MAEVARRGPSPSPAISRPAPAPPPPPATPAVRRPDPQRRGEQVVTGRISGNVTNCQEASKHTQNEVHRARAKPSTKSMLRPESSEKLRMPKSSGGLLGQLDYRKSIADEYKRIPQTHSMQSTAPTQCSSLINCDTSSEFRHKGVQETGPQAILHTKLHRKHYQSEAPWKGNFHVTGDLKHICDGIEAQFPFQIFVRVYEASKQMPEILKLEAVALSQLWPKKFKMKPPDEQDIGLCFVSIHQRSHRSFDHLLEKISSHIGLWTSIGDIELSIFSSKLLPPDYQRKDDKFYFWGIFGKHLRKNRRHCNSHITSMENSNLSQPNEDSDDKSEDTVMKLDARKEKEIETAQPNSYPASSCARAAPAASLINGCCNRDPVNKSTFSIADSPSQLDNVASSGADLNECEVVLGTPDSNSASNGAATVSLPDGRHRHGFVNKSTSSLADSPCQPANISSAGSDLMLDTPNALSPKIDRINGCHVVSGTPNSNPASSCADPFDSPLSRRFGRDWNKSTFSVSDSICQPANTSSVGSDLMLDTHPGYSLNVPPGLTKAQCQNEANDVSNVDARRNLVMDTPGEFSNNIPPGFTEADRRLPTVTSTEPEPGVSTPVTEKKPLIRFSLNIPKLVKTEIIPGFTMPNAVEKEPESPAVDKAKETTPSPLASGTSSVRKAGKADGITRGKATVEDDENSEEREFPKIRRLSELYSRPRSCTEVCRSVSTNLADKFQAAEQPEQQRHPAKRVMQEPPEPYLADTAKRLKVNGRLALNKGVDRQTNQDQENGRR
ncbi:hypothetical protein QOZ80_3BG0289290 [Eleusine coracana subsp. coracana]|nr:hypothetical protein QOZ80_3BG0289290 [Eleusine coracana subsp. coracana]